MMTINYKDISLPVIDSYTISKSSQAVSFSDLRLDFTGHKESDLPEKYQEIKVIDDDKVKYFGYVDSYTLSELREKDVDIEMNLTMISPMSLSTLRTVILVGTYEIKDLIRNIFQPLIDDGFTIKELNVTSRQITANFLLETVEYCMNNISNSYNIWWFIDEQKNIYVKDIELLFKEEPKCTYNDKNSIPGLQYIKPTVSSGNYANVVNFKNVRIYQISRFKKSGSSLVERNNPLIDDTPVSLKEYGSIDFKFPIDTKTENLIKSATSNNVFGTLYAIYCSGTYTDGSTFNFYISYDSYKKEYTMSNNLGYDGNSEYEDKEFLLVRDAFFSNLVTGFRYNGSKTVNSITEIKSDSALIWNVMKLYNERAISSKAGIISKTGIVEYTVDMNNQWKTIQELRDIGVSYIDKNSGEFDGQLELMTDRDVLEVGDVVYINKLMFNNRYIVTEINENCYNNDTNYTIIARNSNILDNYIDLFRSDITQESSDKLVQVYIAHYFEEQINEVHEVV